MVELLGKRRPLADALSEAMEEGFDKVELYLEPAHLDLFEDTLSQCAHSHVSVEAIHTPHVMSHETEYFEKADKLANELDSFLVIHSGGLHFSQLDEFEEEFTPTAKYGYENQPGYSLEHLEEAIFSRKRPFVLDTAHLYVSSPDSWLDHMETILRDYSNSVRHVHFCDGLPSNDGFAIGDGRMDMQSAAQLIEKYHDGQVVLEVPVDDQRDALDWWNSTIADSK